MKLFLLSFLFFLTTFLSAQTDLNFSKEYQILEARRKAAAFDNQQVSKTLNDESGYRGYDVKYYALNLDIYPDDYFMLGKVDLRAIVTDPELSSVWLDFSTFLTVDSILYNPADWPVRPRWAKIKPSHISTGAARRG